VNNTLINKLKSEAQNAQNKGNYAIAIDRYSKILAVDPTNHFSMNNLSIIYLNQSRLDLAEEILIRLMSCSEGDAASFNHLAIVYMRTYRLHQAKKLLEHALSLDPFKIETFQNLTNVCAQLKENDSALHYALEAIKIDPTSSAAFNNLGSVFNAMAKFEEARLAFETAIELDGKNLEALVNFGTANVILHNVDEAIKIYERGLKKLPKHASTQSDIIKFLLSFEYLKVGRLKEGWNYYDCGFHPSIPLGNARSPARTFKKPRWNGQPIKEKTLLVWREQGLGDEMMYLSLIPDLIKYVENIILEVDYRLVVPLQRSFPTVKVREQRYGSPPHFEALDHDYDYHVPLASLMRYLRSSIDDFNNSGPYLSIDPIKRLKFRERLIYTNDKLRIGICWRSGVIDPLRELTYLGIIEWGDLFKLDNVEWVNLQYGECEQECLEAEKAFGIKIIRWSDLNLKDDLDDVFALMSELDYVVTVATAVHHMAASIGCETLLITPKGAWNRFNLDYDPWFSNLHPFIVDYQNLAEALPVVRDYIVANGKPVAKLNISQ
jgi:tetratricopeptide (TPR) repeat protein